MPYTPAVTIRPALPDDVPVIDALVHELAVYEKEPDAVEATPGDFATALFGPDPRVHCHVAEVRPPGGEPEVVGRALWYVTFSTWRGRHGIWLEDLFVRPEHRGAGHGRALLQALFDRADGGRVEWAVLDWNEPSIRFYRSLGARPVDGWTRYRWLAGG